MTIMLHRYIGVLPAGDQFGFGWHSQTGSTVDTSHANAVLWINDAWAGVAGAPGLHGRFNTAVVLQRIVTTQMDAVAPYHTIATRETDVTLAGTDTGTPLPQDTAIVVTLRSGLSGRSGRGRFYLPAPGVGDLSPVGELASASITAIVSSLTAAWAAVNPAGEQPVVWSKQWALAHPIERFGVGSVFDRQARRVNKVSTVRTFANMP